MATKKTKKASKQEFSPGYKIFKEYYIDKKMDEREMLKMFETAAIFTIHVLTGNNKELADLYGEHLQVIHDNVGIGKQPRGVSKAHARAFPLTLALRPR